MPAFLAVAPNPVEMRERRDKVAARLASLQPPRLPRSLSASSRRGAQVPTFPGCHPSSSPPSANVPRVPAFPVVAYIRLVSGLFWPCVPISQSVDTAKKSAMIPSCSILGSCIPFSNLDICVLQIFVISDICFCVYPAFKRAAFSFCPKVSRYIFIPPFCSMTLRR